MAFQLRFSGKHQLANSAVEAYFEQINESEKFTDDNLNLMRFFTDSREDPEYATKYVRKISYKSFSLDLNKAFIIAFRHSPGVQNVILAYLERLSPSH